MRKSILALAIFIAGIFLFGILHHNLCNQSLRAKLYVELTNLHESGKISDRQYEERSAQLHFGDVYAVDMFVWNVNHQ